MSTLLAKYLLSKNYSVLAIDADHNMDLSYNLGFKGSEKTNYLGSAMNDLLSYSKLEKGEGYRAIFTTENMPIFHLSPSPDEFTTKYTTIQNDNLSLMITGPHTDDILNDKACSHILSTPLKAYLPLLKLAENEIVIMDEKAGSDGAGTGICSGMDIAVIVVEPTEHSVKAAKQIIDLLNHYGTPYLLIVNKSYDDADLQFVQDNIDAEVVAVFGMSRAVRDLDIAGEEEKLQSIFEKAQETAKFDRLERSLKKFEKNT